MRKAENTRRGGSLCKLSQEQHKEAIKASEKQHEEALELERIQHLQETTAALREGVFFNAL